MTRLEELAEGIRRKIALARRPFPLIEAGTEAEGMRLAAEYEGRWGPDHDMLLIIWHPEEEAAAASS